MLVRLHRLSEPTLLLNPFHGEQVLVYSSAYSSATDKTSFHGRPLRLATLCTLDNMVYLQRKLGTSLLVWLIFLQEAGNPGEKRDGLHPAKRRGENDFTPPPQIEINEDIFLLPSSFQIEA